jgi:hypothetical protein
MEASGDWPSLDNLSVDLTGAQFSRATPIPKERADAQPSIIIENLSISAAPLHFENTPVHFHLRASMAECGFARDSSGLQTVQLLRAKSGSIEIEAQRADLEIALKNIAGGFLNKQGAEVKAARLELNDRGPNSLAVRAEITAKAFLMTAQVAVTGRLDLDEQFNLRVRDLATSGSGMIANLASGFLRPRFAEIEKRSIPLAAYSFAGVTLHGVRISGENALRIEARFGA